MSRLTRDRNIENWDAEDVAAWEGEGVATPGKDIAKRNLIWSVFAELCVVVGTRAAARPLISSTIRSAHRGRRALRSSDLAWPQNSGWDRSPMRWCATVFTPESHRK